MRKIKLLWTMLGAMLLLVGIFARAPKQEAPIEKMRLEEVEVPAGQQDTLSYGKATSEPESQ